MQDLHLPVTISMIEEWANLIVKRVNPKRSVNRSWVYYLVKRLPPDLKLVIITQKTKKVKRIEAEDIRVLQF